MPIPGLDAGGVTPELKLRLNLYCSWTWCFSFLFLFFVCLFSYCGFSIFISITIIFFPLSILSTSPSSSSHPYSHSLHSPSFSSAKMHCSPPQQFILPLLTHSLPLPSPSLPILPEPVSRLSLSPIHSSPADQPTISTLQNLKPLQFLTQASSTTTEIYPNTHKDHKTSSSHTASRTHPPYFPPPPLVFGEYLTPQISITSLTNINLPTPTAYGYYYQGVFYITYKLLVRY
jgi:hypothetical protein